MPDGKPASPGSSGKASTTKTEKETILSSDRPQILHGSTQTHTNPGWCSFHLGADFQVLQGIEGVPRVRYFA